MNQRSELSPPFHLKADNVHEEEDTYRLTPRKITKHRCSRGPGGKTSVQYLTCWRDVEQPTWEHEQGLENLRIMCRNIGWRVQSRLGRMTLNTVNPVRTCPNARRQDGRGSDILRLAIASLVISAFNRRGSISSFGCLFIYIFQNGGYGLGISEAVALEQDHEPENVEFPPTIKLLDPYIHVLARKTFSGLKQLQL